MQRSPTLEGFRALFRQPSLWLAEIAWRWSFGAAAALLLGLSFVEYLNTLPVNGRDLFLLRTGQPTLVSQALAHILHGSGARAARALLIIAISMAASWIAIASFGRAAVIRSVLSSLLPQDSSNGRSAWRLSGLIGINFFRVATALAATVGLLAAWSLAAAFSPASRPSPGNALLVFLTACMMVGVAWSVVNWFLSLAAIFPVAQGDDTFTALGSAGDLCRSRLGPVAAASFWFGLAHIVIFMIASSVVAFPVTLAPFLPGAVVFGGVLLVTLVYFALADFLYVGRLAAYVAITQLPDAPLPLEINLPSGGSKPPASAAPREAVDPDELILSDVPLA